MLVECQNTYFIAMPKLHFLGQISTAFRYIFISKILQFERETGRGYFPLSDWARILGILILTEMVHMKG